MRSRSHPYDRATSANSQKGVLHLVEFSKSKVPVFLQSEPSSRRVGWKKGIRDRKKEKGLGLLIK